MEQTIAYWMRWPSVEYIIINHTWVWPLCEIFHFVGLILLFGGVGMFDLRLLGVAKGLSPRVMERLTNWGILGFVLCVVTGLVFTTGIVANVGTHPYTVLKTNLWLQLKLIFIALAGLNLMLFNVTGAAKAVMALKPGDDAPGLAKALGAASLFLWLSVIYFGRLIPWDL